MEKQRGVGASELTGRHCYSALIHSKIFKFFKQKKTSSKLLFQKLKTIKKIKSERERERGKTLKKRQRWNEALGGVRVLCTVYIYRLRFKSARVFILALPYLCFFFFFLMGHYIEPIVRLWLLWTGPRFPLFFSFLFLFLLEVWDYGAKIGSVRIMICVYFWPAWSVWYCLDILQIQVKYE